MNNQKSKSKLSKIWVALRSRGWSQKRLSEESGISQQVVWKLCNGYREPKSSEKQRIASALGMSVSELFSPFGDEGSDEVRLQRLREGLNDDPELRKLMVDWLFISERVLTRIAG